jgi:hypothetical protein
VGAVGELVSQCANQGANSSSHRIIASRHRRQCT